MVNMMVKEYMNLLTVVNTTENSKIIYLKDKVSLHGLMGLNTKAILSKGK